jgi:uncharacterized membrane protein YoaK (UPF0700 family)
MFLHVHVFAANMTGNTVLLAIGFAGGQGVDALLRFIAILGFVSGSFTGTALGKPDAPADRTAGNLLVYEAVLLAIVAALWLLAPDGTSTRALIVVAATFAMGLQQRATERLASAPPTSTTYMSGTMERIGSGLYGVLTRSPNGFGYYAAIWLCFFVAALAAAKLAGPAASVLPVVPFCAVALVTAAVRKN